MPGHPCARCDSCGSTQNKALSVKDTLAGIVFVFGIPFVFFLGGIMAGLFLFRDFNGRQIYGIVLGFTLMVFAYIILSKIVRSKNRG